jgi:hypothetical protein
MSRGDEKENVQMTQPFRFLLATLGAVVLPVSVAAQCAMCRASLLNSQGGAELIEGLRQGIFLLLAIPLAITAAVLIRLKQAARMRDAFPPQPRTRDGESYS